MIAKDNFRRVSSLFIGVLFIAALMCFPASGWAQKTQVLSIATGGTGGIYYVMGGGIAALLTKNIPNLKVTAESTAASIENALLIEAGKVDLTLILGSTSYDAIMGKERFTRKIPLRALGVITSRTGEGFRRGTQQRRIAEPNAMIGLAHMLAVA